MAAAAAFSRCFASNARVSAIRKKREWYDLKEQKSKGVLIKHILALANSTAPDHPAHLLIGVADDRDGGKVLGVETIPDIDQLARALNHYTQPVSDVRMHAWDVGGKKLALLRISWTDNYPYYASRDIDGELSSDVVYHRVGPTVAKMKPAQFEKLLRQKAAGAHTAAATDTIRIGFVEAGSWNGPSGPVLRVTNLSGEAIQGVAILFDAVATYDPRLFARQRSLTNATLGAGETRDIECNLRDLRFDLSSGPNHELGRHVSDRWLDVLAHVQFRDELGFLASMIAVVRVT